MGQVHSYSTWKPWQMVKSTLLCGKFLVDADGQVTSSQRQSTNAWSFRTPASARTVDLMPHYSSSYNWSDTILWVLTNLYPFTRLNSRDTSSFAQCRWASFGTQLIQLTIREHNCMAWAMLMATNQAHTRKYQQIIVLVCKYWRMDDPRWDRRTSTLWSLGSRLALMVNINGQG